MFLYSSHLLQVAFLEQFINSTNTEIINERNTEAVFEIYITLESLIDTARHIKLIVSLVDKNKNLPLFLTENTIQVLIITRFGGSVYK